MTEFEIKKFLEISPEKRSEIKQKDAFQDACEDSDAVKAIISRLERQGVSENDYDDLMVIMSRIKSRMTKDD